MGLEDDFHQTVKEWIECCKKKVHFSSEIVTECDAYEKIILMDKKVLPLLRQLYDADASFYDADASFYDADASFYGAERDLPLSMIKGRGIANAVRRIVGDDFQIPEEIRRRVSASEDYTKRWLDENMSRYVSTR